MKVRTKEISKVKKFNLDKEEEKIEYESILNNHNCTITRDSFSYDKMGRALITIWYREKAR